MAGESGQLRALCDQFGVSLLVLFGSAIRPDASPHDLDVAVQFDSNNPDVLGFVDALSEIAGTSSVDLMDLRRAGPVARERALVGGRALVESTNGLFRRAQLAAMMERMDTDWLRRIDLDLLAA
jgi:predicted nucleotidyltransferase